MASSHSETKKMEQIITEFFAKGLHIILESRTPYVLLRNFSGEQIVSSLSSSSLSSSSVQPRDKWFNLALRECPAALENIDLWRQSNLEPMVIDVILVQRPVDWNPVSFSPKRDLPKSVSVKERYPFSYNTDQEELGFEAKSEKIIERWVLQYEGRKGKDCSSMSRRLNKSNNSTLHTLYKKSTLLLRSLYATVRLLPAYKIFRDLNLSGQILALNFAHRVSSFVEPFTRREETEMQQFGFTPVDTSYGRLCLSVLYQSSVSGVSSKPSTPMSPRVIPDYVGSPLVDPFRRFPSVPVTGSPSHGSPSSFPFSRRQSWSYDQYRAFPSSITCSPSPTFSELRASVSNLSSRPSIPTSLPPQPPETSLVHKNNTSYDQYYPLPNLSPSRCPAPPIYLPGSQLSKTPPASIPNANTANSPGFSNRHNFPPSPPYKDSRYTPKSDRTGEVQTGAAVEKLFSLWKDEYRRFSGLKMSSTSLRQISFSRSSSRSYHDDYDDPDFTCPFDVDDDDMADPSSRAESLDQGHRCEPLEHGRLFPIRKSQDASVGTLVRMLKKAPPLCQDFSGSVDLSQGSRAETLSNNIREAKKIPGALTPVSAMSSGLVMRKKTTTDALEELQGYREMKNFLLMRGSNSHI